MDEGTAISHNLLHLTIQDLEYLPTFHLSQQPAEKHIKHLRMKNKTNSLKMHPIFHGIAVTTEGGNVEWSIQVVSKNDIRDASFYGIDVMQYMYT